MVILDLCGIPPAPNPGPVMVLHPLLRAKSVSVVPFLRFADNVLYNLTSRAKGVEHLEVIGRLQGSRLLWLCFSAWNVDWLTISIIRWFALAQVFRLDCSSYCPFLQGYPLNLSTPTAEGSTSHNPITPLSTVSPVMSSWLQGCSPGSSQHFTLLTSLVCSHLANFRCFNVQISWVCFLVEQGILCWCYSCSNYWSCKGSKQKDISCHHSSDVTLEVFKKLSIKNHLCFLRTVSILSECAVEDFLPHLPRVSLEAFYRPQLL